MSILEGTCARECAKRIDEKGLKKLENLYKKLERHFEEEHHEKYMAVNHSYHTLVQELAGSKVLSEVINGLRQKILLHRYRQIYQPNRLMTSMQEHRALQEAFRKRDPVAAERLMKEHLIRQCEALENADHKPEGRVSSGIGLSFENQRLDRVARPSDAVHISLVGPPPAGGRHKANRSVGLMPGRKLERR